MHVNKKYKGRTMTLNIHFEDSFTPIFQTLVDSFTASKRELTNTILMKIIFSINAKNKELRDILFDIEENPQRLENMNLEDFYDMMGDLEDNFKPLLSLAKKHKNKSEMFLEFYKALNTFFETINYVNIEVGFIEAEYYNDLIVSKHAS